MDDAASAAAVTVLSRMTRKGARLIPFGDSYHVRYPGERAQSRTFGLRRVDTAHVRTCLDQKWLQTDSDGALRLTEAGALALRRGSTHSEEPRTIVTPEPVAQPIILPRPPARSAATGALARLASIRGAGGKPLISSGQREAGERLARDFVHGQMTPRVTANWDRAALGSAGERLPGAFAADISDGVAAAQERVRRAMSDVGPEFADLLLDVCCLDVGLETIEKQRGWPPRSGRIVLGLALDRLIRHYGIVTAGPQQARMDVHHQQTTG